MSAQNNYLDIIAACIGDVSDSIDAIDTKDIVLSISELANVLKETNKLLKEVADSNKAIAMNAYQYVANKVWLNLGIFKV